MFVLLYDAEVVEEEAFLKWKEDVSEKHPGKGKALFQVGSAVFFSFLGIFSELSKLSEWLLRLERFSIECRKTKTRVITLANHNGHR